MRTSAIAVACALLCASSAALAGPPAEDPRPVAIPWTFAPEQRGVESLLHHAAGLGYMSSLEVGLGVTTRLDGDAPVNSVVGLAGGRLGPLALALGVSSIGDGPGTDTATTRVDLGFALRLGDHAALGAAWHGLSNDADAALDDYDSWSLSLDLRPFRALAVALAVDRLDTPELGETSLDPVARLAIGLRPATERITIGIEAARTLGDDALWTAGGSVRFLLIPGLVLGGYGRYVFAESGPSPDRVEAGAFLGLYQGGVSLESSVDLADSDAAQDSRMSFLLAARSVGEPSLTHRTDVVVKLPIRGPIPERPAQRLFGPAASGFAQWLQYLDILADDPDVRGVVLQIEAAPTWAQMWELRRAMQRLKDHGKRIHAVLTIGDMRAMYLASIADKLHLHRAGGLFLTGLATTRTYYFGLMEKLGIKAEIVRYEEYKSTPEMLTQAGPSEASKEADRALLDGIWKEWRGAVTAGRALTDGDIDRLLEGGPQTMHVAVKERLVDDLIDDDAISEAVEQDLPGAHVVDSYRPAPRAWKRWGGQRRIAILPVVGSIVDGKSGGALPIPILGGETTGDASFVPALQAAAADASVVGIVVRVSSGGGSAIASDKMHRALTLAAKKKPVVVSFGDIAASGGYYLAAGAPKILCTPVTITGSIGIFSGKADLSGLYGLLGLATSTERTNERADMMQSHRPWTDHERELAQVALKAYYDRFVNVVAEGRGLDLEAAYAVAHGRVWLGPDALDRKLVDDYGGLWDAIERVRAEAGVAASEPLSLDYVGTLGAFSSFQRLMAGALGFSEPAGALGGDADAASASALGPVGTQAEALSARLRVLSDGGPLALLPYTFSIE
ncbi:MAG: hypothetical protein EP329_11705 [Deltaproteobacteria bacterium]|nr:MAG: hypothetical protein EP329_11705 [Deltaproteobacteria bacterium]